ALVDTLLTKGVNASVEEELRQSRVIRTYQQDYINETLKHLNGLAYQFPSSAAKYHYMAATILVGQLDFEKAAIELMQAEEKGFSQFKSRDLPIFYYGGLACKAFEVSSKHQVDFPGWMRFDADANLIANDTTILFSGLSTLHTMVKEQFLAHLDSLASKSFKRFFAYHLLLNKSHWLNQDELERLFSVLEEDPAREQNYKYSE